MCDVNILVVKPGIVKRADKKLLNNAGVVVIETDDPAAVKFLTPTAELTGSELLLASLIALDSAMESTKGKIVPVMRRMLEAKMRKAS